MKLTSTIVECKWYAIINHEDSDWTNFSKEAIKSPPLTCNLKAADLELRNRSYMVDEDLVASFEQACQGKDERWKLMRISIKEGQLLLVFVDSETMTGTEYKGVPISFDSGHISFSVYAKREGSDVSDEYSIEFFGGGSQEEQIASIEEHRNGKLRTLDGLFCREGKYYLESYLFD